MGESNWQDETFDAWVRRRERELDEMYTRLCRDTLRRAPSPTQPYESLDHFLFQPDLHWNGQTVDV